MTREAYYRSQESDSEDDEDNSKKELLPPRPVPIEGIISWSRDGDGLVHRQVAGHEPRERSDEERLKHEQQIAAETAEYEPEDDEEEDEDEDESGTASADTADPMPPQPENGDRAPAAEPLAFDLEESDHAAVAPEAPASETIVNPAEAEPAEDDRSTTEFLTDLPPIAEREQPPEDEAPERPSYPYVPQPRPDMIPGTPLYEAIHERPEVAAPVSTDPTTAPRTEYARPTTNTDPRVGPLAAFLGLEYFARKRADRKLEQRMAEQVDTQFAAYRKAPESRPPQSPTPERKLASPPEQHEQPEQLEPIALKPSQHVEHSAWHNIVVDEHGHEVAGAIEYGEGFKRERQQEMRRQDQLQSIPVPAPIFVPIAPATDQYGRPLQTNGLPSGMTQPTLPSGQPTHIDPQHQLAEPRKQQPTTGLNPVWIWIMALLILAAFLTAAFV